MSGLAGQRVCKFINLQIYKFSAGFAAGLAPWSTAGTAARTLTKQRKMAWHITACGAKAKHVIAYGVVAARRHDIRGICIIVACACSS